MRVGRFGLRQVPDPHLEIRWGGGGVGAGNPDPEIGEGPSLQKNFFQPFWLQFDLKIRGVGGSRLPDPSPTSATEDIH